MINALYCSPLYNLLYFFQIYKKDTKVGGFWIMF